MSIAFLLTSLIIVAMPGTGALITLSAGVSRGARARASVIAALGCTLGSTLAIESDHPPRSPAVVIAPAMLANLLNPKLTVFFFAFLPQFVPPHAPDELERLLLLSGVFMAMTFIVFVIYGVCAAAVRRHIIERPRVIQGVRRLFVASFVGLGIKLARPHAKRGRRGLRVAR